MLTEVGHSHPPICEILKIIRSDALMRVWRQHCLVVLLTGETLYTHAFPWVKHIAVKILQTQTRVKHIAIKMLQTQTSQAHCHQDATNTDMSQAHCHQDATNTDMSQAHCHQDPTNRGTTQAHCCKNPTNTDTLYTLSRVKHITIEILHTHRHRSSTLLSRSNKHRHYIPFPESSTLP